MKLFEKSENGKLAGQVVDQLLDLPLFPCVFPLVGGDAELGGIQQLADGSGIGVDAFHAWPLIPVELDFLLFTFVFFTGVGRERSLGSISKSMILLTFSFR